MKINLVTGNPGKIKAAKSVFEPKGIEVNNVEEAVPEIQAATSLEIARYTAVETAKKIGAPTLREDHSLFINALGIPGPFMSFIERQISAKKLLKVLENFEDRTGYFEIGTVYAEPDGTTKEFEYQVPIYFKEKETVEDPRGGWNGLICLESETRAFTEYPEEERLDVWNKNYKKLADHLTKQET